jgi:hypothetical protein
VKTKCEGKDKDGNDKTIIRQYEQEDDITILFNPWCPGMSIIKFRHFPAYSVCFPEHYEFLSSNVRDVPLLLINQQNLRNDEEK